MKRFSAIAAVALLIGALVASPAPADTVIHSEDFEGVTPPALPASWFVFSGGDGTPSFTSGTIASGGNPDQAMSLEADGASASSFYFIGTFFQYTGALPTTDLDKLVLTVDMMGSEAAVSEFRIESFTAGFGANTGNIEFAPTPGTGWGEVGGLLSTGTDSTFDAGASNFQIVIAINGANWGLDDDNILKIDNLSFTAVPEPASLGVFAIVGAAALVRRRR